MIELIIDSNPRKRWHIEPLLILWLGNLLKLALDSGVTRDNSKNKVIDYWNAPIKVLLRPHEYRRPNFLRTTVPRTYNLLNLPVYRSRRYSTISLISF